VLSWPARLLDVAFHLVMPRLVQIYDVFSLRISWDANETVCFVMYRGKPTSSCCGLRRSGAKLQFRIRGFPSIGLKAVNQYEHLGSIIPANGDVSLGAQFKVGDTSLAFCPIAVNIFGNPHFGARTKLLLQLPVVVGHLFGAHVVAATARYIEVLSASVSCAGGSAPCVSACSTRPQTATFMSMRERRPWTASS